MSNRETVITFLSCYQNHDYVGIQRCLSPKVMFHDMAFETLKGPDVSALWHSFCVPYGARQEPVKIPSYEVFGEHGGVVSARYRVQYLYEGKRKVDYLIHTVFTLRNGKIVNQRDVNCISPFAFARMAFGYPICFLALTPLFQGLVRLLADRKLQQFKQEQMGMSGEPATIS